MTPRMSAQLLRIPLILTIAAAACTDQPTEVHHVAGGRSLQSLSLVVGQRADLIPEMRDQYDGTPVLSSSAVAFLGMERDTAYSPEGPMGVQQVYHLRAATPGRAVVTIRYTDGTIATQDSIIVLPAVTHGPLAQISVGFFLNTCAAATSAAAFCWGWHADVYDSAGDRERTFDDRPLPLPGGLDWRTITLGFQHACGLTTTGAAYCWGNNNGGQLGDGSTDSSTSPVAVTGGLTFQTVSAGVDHTCGVTTAGAIYCWGNDYGGQLGNDTTSYVNSHPILVSDSLTFITVSGGYEFSCGLTADSAAYCWGDNDLGELGTGNVTSTRVPVPVTGGLKFAALSTGYFHACGLTASGAAYCWGGNFAGELGGGSAGALESCASAGLSHSCSTTPVAVSGGLTFSQISAGQWTTCGVTTDARGFCWGVNNYGQLGNAATAGTGDPNPTPLLVSGGLSFSTVHTGYLHTCGITTSGAAYCWGDNSEGELGDGSTTYHLTPVPVLGP